MRIDHPSCLRPRERLVSFGRFYLKDAKKHLREEEVRARRRARILAALETLLEGDPGPCLHLARRSRVEHWRYREIVEADPRLSRLIARCAQHFSAKGRLFEMRAIHSKHMLIRMPEIEPV